MRLFDFSLKVNGFDIDKAKLALAKIQAKSDIDFESYVLHQKKDIISYHLEHNSFYKIFGKSIDLNHWNSVPIMTKRHLQQPLEQRLSDDFSPKNVYVNKTSGSSGDPFIFAKDKWCHSLTWAEIINRFGWYGIDFNTSKQARFYGIPLDQKGYYKERLKDYFSNRFRFSVFDLSDDAFENTLAKFKRTDFDYINGYTSSIVQFAKFLKRKNSILSTICPSLKACIVTSEMLFEDDKELLEKHLGLPIINEYGASELDLIAFQNINDEWQINSKTLFVEILDENNMVLPNGEEGRIVITSLYNKAHPFIRYDIGDIGVLSKNSTIKKPILKTLIGRTNDLVVLPSGKKAAGLTFYYITKSVIENDGNVLEFIVEQLHIDTFKISYVSNNALSNADEVNIKREMIRYLEPAIEIKFERVEKLKRSKAGKLKQFTSHLN
ncbi:phenylacetate--CoA ligase family protein [Winogradskyella bathintestinalis]|uniref:Phenylacetate--CoA ligase family protein n=1 Tax=Winogradskyella bathintestinalis TaxID=3035208 RepID=A0ABT7ZRE8_9FLAO|nr:phenylacetate--CoA ligase family protein [Winogradskyella bathintestinalis]MDN3491592.1 phenylacetate--CoA ligase family protein [Winogradskyella bathintestinalis]